MRKVISLKQPWASLVVMGIKTVETRSWKTKYTGELLIHASKADILLSEISHMGRYLKGLEIKNGLPLGCIIGSVNLKGIQTTEEWLQPETVFGNPETLTREATLGDFKPGRYAWILENPVQFKQPVPAKGALSIWSFRQCRQCGCSDMDPCCSGQFGPCSWVADDICSHCHEQVPRTDIKRHYQTFVKP